MFQDYYEATILKEYSASTVSWIPSLQIFFMMALGPVIGLIYDKYGPRWLIIGGTFLHVFGLMMTSISTEYYQILLSQGVCSAIGVSAIFQPGEHKFSRPLPSKINVKKQPSTASRHGSPRNAAPPTDFWLLARAWEA